MSEDAARPVELYVTEYNSVLPHSAHACRTPDEVYSNKAVDVPDKLAVARASAREARLAANRERDCVDCRAAMLPA